MCFMIASVDARAPNSGCANVCDKSGDWANPVLMTCTSPLQCKKGEESGGIAADVVTQALLLRCSSMNVTAPAI